jgi:hypothetical protein
MKTERKTARIFEDVGGYYFCDDGLPYLDTRGTSYDTVTAARQAAWESGYNYAVGSGAPASGRLRPGKYSQRYAV